MILGIHDGHNASVCFFRDGEIAFAIQEERLRREKNWNGMPLRSIELGLKELGADKGDVNEIVLNGEHMPRPKDRDMLIEEFRSSDKPVPRLKRALKGTIVDSLFISRRKAERVRELTEADFPPNKIRFLDHHHCHAATAYYGWGKYDRPVLVLTNDGAGDRICASVNIADKGKINRIAQVPESHSVASLYAYTTFLTGMVPLEHEYKLMGMAPYADRDLSRRVADRFWDFFEFDQSNLLIWRRKKPMPHAFGVYEFLRKEMELVRFDGIMGGIQLFTEEILIQWVKNCIAQTGIRRVAFAGGIFMNVKANKRIMELDEVEEMFVFPSCGDETNAIGACYAKYAENDDYRRIRPLGPFYLGPTYSDLEIKSALDRHSFGGCRVKIEHLDNIEKKVAELLATGTIVARFKGREEFGARAMGNRSILADPAKEGAVKTINEMIKNRDFWMPFALSILDANEDRYLVNPKKVPSPYMIMTYDTVAEHNAEIRGGTHPYDHTCRPQVVYKDWNPDYWRLINEFKAITGRCAVLNTSFNLHGFPLVSAPEDAFFVLKRSGLTHMAIGNYLVVKE